MWRTTARQQLSQRTFHRRAMEGRMPNACADAEPIAVDGKAPQRLHPVDVDEMGRPRQSECHDRNETLAPGQDTSVERRDFSQQAHRFVNRLRCMVSEGSNLHLGPVSAVAASIDSACADSAADSLPARWQFE
jgi:hypothetical protein